MTGTLIRKGNLDIHTHTHTHTQTMPRHREAKEEDLKQKQTLLTTCSWSTSLQNCEKINFCGQSVAFVIAAPAN